MISRENDQRLSSDAKAILAAVQAMQDAAAREQEGQYEALRREMLALSAAVKTAFPGGDFDGHRRYHELLIERESQRQQIRREVITHLIKGSTWAALCGLIFMVLRHAKEFLK